MGAGSGLSLGERAALSGVGGASGSAAGAQPAGPLAADQPGAGLVLQDRDAGARHCWVVGLAGVPDKCPGLLSMWGRDPAGAGRWFGRVVYAVEDGVRTVLVEAWVPAEHLEPAGV